MNAAAEASQSELDRVTDAAKPEPGLADELFGVADLLVAQASLRNALADPANPDERRRGLAEAVFSPRVSDSALRIVAEATALRWGSGLRLAEAIDRQGLRALFGLAQAAGTLDGVEEQLFRFSRTVAADPRLRQALDDRNAPVAVRRQLVSDLIGAKADPVTVQLAQRAVGSTRGGFEVAAENYLELAAEAQQRAVATVTIAQPLTDAQRARLERILATNLGRPVNLQVIVDPAVLGGARVRVGDEVIEGTVAGRLAAAQQQLTQ